jgi:hypothetical protein
VDYYHPQHGRPGQWPDDVWPSVAPFHAVVLRQPFDWYWSVWRYLRQPGQESDPELFRPLVQKGLTKRHLDRFEEFALKFAGFYSELIREFTAKPCVVLRTESLASDLTNLMDALFPGVDGIERIRQLPPVNVGPAMKKPRMALERLINQSEPAYWLACN